MMKTRNRYYVEWMGKTGIHCRAFPTIKSRQQFVNRLNSPGVILTTVEQR